MITRHVIFSPTNNILLFLLLLTLSSFPQNRLSLNTELFPGEEFDWLVKESIDLNSSYKSRNELSLKTLADKNLNCLCASDSIDYEYITWEKKRKFWFAALELGIIEFIPWALARWGRTWEDPEDNWAKISTETVWRNITSGWEYDGDNFITNNFAHPYHGNLFFNVGRSNGYDFWESSIWAFTGSAAWEFFAETFRPAINDWVATSINGINLGEMLYRLSSVVTDNTASGSERVFQEIGGGLLNPVRGINRLLSGETARIFPNNEESNPKSFTTIFNIGIRRWITNYNTSSQGNINEGFLFVSLLYGNLFTGNIQKPFSSFNVSAVISTGSPTLTNLQSFGNLYGWNLFKKDRTRHLLLISLNYNYFDNPDFNYGGTSVTPHLVSVFGLGKETNLFTNVGIDLIAMGATPTDYYEDVEGRNYDVGPGIGINLGASINKGIWSLVRFFYSSKWIWTQSEPSDSKHHLHFAWLDVEFPLTEHFALSLGSGVYWRNSVYKFEPDVNKTTPVIRLLVKAAIF